MAEATATADENQERRIEDVAETIWRSYPHDWIPKLVAELGVLAEIEKAGKQADSTVASPSNISESNAPRRMPCPHCRNSLDIPPDTNDTQITCGSCGSSVDLVEIKNSTRFRPPIKRIANYELIEFLDAGSFGSVWKARDVDLLAAVAIKIPHKKPLMEEDKARIKSEARAQGQLDHPNIVRIRQVLDDGETLFIVSDLIRGIRLSDCLTHRQPTIREAVQWCVKISSALHHAHEHRVFHRDLKPANILIDSDGEPHLTDFGLAKHDLDRVTVTQDGQVLGTAAYMSAEQADGRSHNVDGRTDVYSMGVILFELLTGQLPFRGNERAIIHAHVHEPAPSPRKFNDRVERDLETICLKCLEKDPAQRFQSADELRQDLERFLAGEPILSRPISPVARAWRWCKRKPLVAGLSAAVVLALLVGTAVSTYFAVQAIRGQATLLSVRHGALAEQARTTRIARQVGYRSKVFGLLKQARELPIPELDIDQLRQEAVGCLGDFVGLEPIVPSLPPNQILKAIALDSNGTQLAAGFEDGAAAVYDIASGRWSQLPEHHPGEIQSLRYLANGSQIVILLADGVIQTWTRGAEGGWTHAKSLALKNEAAPDSKFELTPGGGGVLVRHASRIELWDIAQKKVVGGFDAGEGQRLLVVAVSPDHKWLAFTSRQGLQLAEFATGREIARVPVKDQSYQNSLIFSPDSQWLALVSDRGLTTFAVPTLREREVDRSGPIKAVAFSPDSQQVVTFGIRGDVVLRRTDTNPVAAALSHPRSYATSASGVRFSGDGGYLASFDGGSIRLWPMRATQERMTLDGHVDSVPCVVFNPAGTVLASASKDKTVKLWDPTNGTLTRTLNGFKGMVQNAAFSPNGQLFVTAQWTDEQDQIQFWDTQNWQPVSTQWLNEPEKSPIGKSPRFLATCRVAFSPPGKEAYFATADRKGVVLWRMSHELADGGRLRELRFEFVRHWPGDRCFDCAISPDGTLLAWVEKPGRINKSKAQDEYRLRLWDLINQQSIDSTAPRLLQEWHSLAFFPDSRRLAFIGESKQAEVWRLPDSKQLFTLDKAEPFLASHIALNKRNGIWFAGKNWPNEVVVWDILQRKRMFALRSEATEIISLDWSPDGRRLALRTARWARRRLGPPAGQRRIEPARAGLDRESQLPRGGSTMKASSRNGTSQSIKAPIR